MFLADYHTHSDYSSDGRDSMTAMLRRARDAGLNELCITDHCDVLGDPFPAAERYEYFNGLRGQNDSGVKPLLGIELGEATHDLARAEAETAAAPYDFIIGSYHALKNEMDFYHLRYNGEEDCHRLLARYFAELRELAGWGGFDVLGHIDYPLRYMRRAGFAPALLPRYEDELKTLFGLLVQKGLGIELNLSAPNADPAVYALYKQCGGEAVTMGSDAHSADKVARNFGYGLDVLRRAGFTRVAAFEQRRMRFEKI